MTPLPLFDATRLDAAEEFVCAKLHCRIRRIACGQRAKSAQDPLCAPCLRACAGCPTGELHAALVVGPVRQRRRVGDVFRSRAVYPRNPAEVPPWPEVDCG